MTETLANGYSSESTPQELSNEYQHDRVWIVFKDFYVLLLWMKVVSALEGLSPCPASSIQSWRDMSLLGLYYTQCTSCIPAMYPYVDSTSLGAGSVSQKGIFGVSSIPKSVSSFGKRLKIVLSILKVM